MLGGSVGADISEGPFRSREALAELSICLLGRRKLPLQTLQQAIVFKFSAKRQKICLLL